MAGGAPAAPGVPAHPRWIILKVVVQKSVTTKTEIKTIKTVNINLNCETVKTVVESPWNVLIYIPKIPLTRIAFTSQQGLNHDIMMN